MDKELSKQLENLEKITNDCKKISQIADEIIKLMNEMEV